MSTGAQSIVEKVDLLLNKNIQELEERRGREADDVVVVAVDLADEHPAEALWDAASVSVSVDACDWLRRRGASRGSCRSSLVSGKRREMGDGRRVAGGRRKV